MLIALTGALAMAAPTCADIEFEDCVDSPHGVVINGGDDAAQIAAVIDDAAARFERHFARVPVPIAVVMGGDVPRETQAMLTDAGFKVMPWLSDADKMRLAELQIRNQLEEQLGTMGEAVIENAMKQARSQLTAQLKPAAQDVADGALAHEIAHQWFIRFYPEQPVPGGPRIYGGPAPDWLDETAAVLAENATLHQKRRDALAAGLMARDENEQLYSLADFFTMEHPSLASVRDMIDEETLKEGGSRVRIISTDDPENAAFAANNPVRFYVLALGFADYLMEKTGDERIFATIANAIADGATMEDWLAANTFGLPTTIPALEEDFRAWALPDV